MRERLKRCESLLWLFMKLCLYILLMAVFMLLLSIENKPLLRLSRTMGTSVITFVVVGLLFLSIYGKFDVGRRKSKPIIYSISLAVIFTDIVTYVQLMIMNTITPSIYALRFVSIGALIATMVVQVIIITIFAYAGNALFLGSIARRSALWSLHHKRIWMRSYGGSGNIKSSIRSRRYSTIKTGIS